MCRRMVAFGRVLFRSMVVVIYFFFFQAEDGIRDSPVTGVQTCALPISECQELLLAFEKNQKAGKMAFTFRGQMVDVPHLTRARTILERAKQAGVFQGRS